MVKVRQSSEVEISKSALNETRSTCKARHHMEARDWWGSGEEDAVCALGGAVLILLGRNNKTHLPQFIFFLSFAHTSHE